MLMALLPPAVRRTRLSGTLARGTLVSGTLGLALLLALGLTWPAAAAGPPPQPKTGPGGADYEIKDVVKKAYGEGSAQAFVFRPGGAAAQPRPVSADYDQASLVISSAPWTTMRMLVSAQRAEA